MKPGSSAVDVYLNNAATSFPKPPEVLQSVLQSLQEPPREVGRSASGDAAVLSCRQAIADLFGVAHSERVALTPSATYAINTVIAGIFAQTARPAHVVATDLEHNSVLRPLWHLAASGHVDVTHVAPDPDGQVDAADVAAALRDTTRLICVAHASNVTGCIQPVNEIAALAAHRAIPVLIDAAQSAGAVPLEHGALPGRTFIALAGHKGLLGPMGTGALILPDNALAQTFVGGTGIRSALSHHPPELPLRHEAGTPNVPGLCGLLAGMRFVREQGVVRLGAHRQELVLTMREHLGRLPGVWLSPLSQGDGRGGIVSFTRHGWQAGELSHTLLEGFGILTRSGLHCAPRAHRCLGTDNGGTVRASVGPFSTTEDVERLVRAVAAVGTR